MPMKSGPGFKIGLGNAEEVLTVVQNWSWQCQRSLDQVSKLASVGPKNIYWGSKLMLE